MRLFYHNDGNHNFVFLNGKTKLGTPAGAWCNYSPPLSDHPGEVLMMYGTRESRHYATLLLGLVGLHSRENYGELPVGSHNLSAHSFPIQKRMASILGQLAATAPVNNEDWFSSIDAMKQWEALPKSMCQELSLADLDAGKEFLIQVVHGDITGRVQPAFIERESNFAEVRRANGRALDARERLALSA